MPSIKHRQRVIAGNFITKTGVNVDERFGWHEFFVAASSRSMAGSIAVYDVSGSLQGLRFTSTSSTCALFPLHLVPQGVAISGPASGSGTLYVDWTNVTTANACITFTACVIHIPTGSALGDTGTSTLGSGCAAVQGTAASEITTSCLFDFNSPTVRGGLIGVRLIVNTKDNQSNSGSDTVLFGARLRYKADRIGS